MNKPSIPTPSLTRPLARLFAVVALALPLAVLAQGSRIDARQAEQDRRIEQGVQSGSLTAQEAARLEQGQAAVQRAENRALADGTVTRRERAHIENMQDRQSERIYRQKHDRQHDYNHNGRVDRPRRAVR